MELGGCPPDHLVIEKRITQYLVEIGLQMKTDPTLKRKQHYNIINSSLLGSALSLETNQILRRRSPW